MSENIVKYPQQEPKDFLSVTEKKKNFLLATRRCSVVKGFTRFVCFESQMRSFWDFKEERIIKTHEGESNFAMMVLYL